MADKQQNLFERANSAADGSGYSFFIDGSFLEQSQKLTFTILKRGKGNKREDMGKFFLHYRTLRSVISIVERKLRAYSLLKSKEDKAKFSYSESFYGGADGKRRLVISVKDGKIFFNIYDNIVQTERAEHKNYSGKGMFSLNGAIDMQEFFDLRTTLSNWEITKIGKLVNYDPNKTEDSK